MPTLPFYTSTEQAFAVRLQTFVLKVPDYLGSISVVTPANIAQAQALLDGLHAVLNGITLLESHVHSLTAAKNTLLYQGGSGQVVNWAAPPLHPPLVMALPGAQIIWLQHWIMQIKHDAAYNMAVGAALGIEKPSPAAVNDYTAKPVINNPRSVSGGHVSFGWVKDGYDAVGVESQRAGETVYASLGRSSYSPFNDLRPLLVPAQPEERRYRIQYYRGDTLVGLFSDITTVVAK